jgi:ribosome-binding ATPase YchF (GTP1/OBG family)
MLLLVVMQKAVGLHQADEWDRDCAFDVGNIHEDLTDPLLAGAWTIRAGATANDAADVIHSDFRRGSNRAEIVAYGDLVAAGSMAAARV